MSSPLPHHRTLESLKKEAKRWLANLRAHVSEARARFLAALDRIPSNPTLRDVQHALAREHGFAGWDALKTAMLKRAAASDIPSAMSLTRFEEMANALLEAYRTGTPEAMERHYRLTWHRRPWSGMRSYVQLDLGKRPATPDAEVEITLADAQYLVAREQGFDDWNALVQFVAQSASGRRLAGKRLRLVTSVEHEGAADIAGTRDWDELLSMLHQFPGAVLRAEGEMTDAMLKEISAIDTVTALDLAGSQQVTDEGVRYLASMPQLRHLTLDSTAITDAGLSTLQHLPMLETISLAMTRVTDAGVVNLSYCSRLQMVNLSWTRTGDGAINSLAGIESLRVFRSGAFVTDAGLPMLHDIPAFKVWQGGEVEMALLSHTTRPNQLMLRGSFTDAGMTSLGGLDGLFGLNIDDAGLPITAAAMIPLVSLPNLGWLSVDAKDDWMPFIARMPKLKFLGVQDTTAGDDGFAALSQSQSLEYIWGRRSHNLRRRGFAALATMPALRGLAVSCLNVEDAGIAMLPDFPALRELMPVDIPDAGYRHIGKCSALESLILMYCRDTTDAATEQIVGLQQLQRYFNSYTEITDRTPELLSGLNRLEKITFDACHGLTDAGVSQLAKLPNLKELRVSGRGVTGDLVDSFSREVKVFVGG